MTPKDFYRARSQAEHELRRDGKLSLADRMVGLEIFSYVNRKTGCAYPSQETIAHSLKVDERTVRRAAKHLTAAGYLKVSRRGRHNVYSPILSPRKPDNMSAIDAPAATPDIHAPIPDIHAPIPDTDVPLTLLRTLIRTLGARSLPRLTALARPANRQGSNSSPPSDGTASRTSQETKAAIWRHVGQMSPTTKSSNSSASTANPQPRLRFLVCSAMQNIVLCSGTEVGHSLELKIAKQCRGKKDNPATR